MTLSWSLIAYVLCGVAAAGLLGAQGITALGGHGSRVQSSVTGVALLLAIASIVFGALRLGRIERFFNVFGHLSSGISQGYLAVVILIVVALIGVIALRRADEEGELPLWCAILFVLVLLVCSYGIAANLTATSRSVAKTILATVYLLAASGTVGALICGNVSNGSSTGKAHSYGKGVIGCALAIVTGVLAIVCAAIAPGLGGHIGSVISSQYGMVGVHPTDGIGASITTQVLTGPSAVQFWMLAVVVGAVIPAVLAIVSGRVESKVGLTLRIIAALCVLAGVAATVAFALFTNTVTSLLAI